jgi:formamidopyrimidine-DNA glycosylase
MPELPEVETLRRQLAGRVDGERIVDVVHATHPRFRAAHAGRGCQVTTVDRRGKYLLVGLDSTAASGVADRELVIHLGMTGQLIWSPRSDPPRDHVHAGLVFLTGVLWVRDPRRFGRIEVVEPGAYACLPTLAMLGPEPDDAEFTVARVRRFLGPAGVTVKARLLEQRLLAGVGNYVCDEALWWARVNPQARSLDDAACRRLHRALRRVITESLADGGVSVRDYVQLDGAAGKYAAQLRVHGRAGLPCPRCATVLVRASVAGRTTVWCRQCQPG